jgi:hypothetical protein
MGYGEGFRWVSQYVRHFCPRTEYILIIRISRSKQRCLIRLKMVILTYSELNGALRAILSFFMHSCYRGLHYFLDYFYKRVD